MIDNDGRCIRCCRKPESVQEMKNWNLQFAPNLLTIQARQLQPEMIYQTAQKQNGVRFFLRLSQPIHLDFYVA